MFARAPYAQKPPRGAILALTTETEPKDRKSTDRGSGALNPLHPLVQRRRPEYPSARQDCKGGESATRHRYHLGSMRPSAIPASQPYEAGADADASSLRARSPPLHCSESSKTTAA